MNESESGSDYPEELTGKAPDVVMAPFQAELVERFRREDLERAEARRQDEIEREKGLFTDLGLYFFKKLFFTSKRRSA